MGFAQGLGAVVGGVGGFLIGGPVGAAAGIAAGSQLGSGIDSSKQLKDQAKQQQQLGQQQLTATQELATERIAAAEQAAREFAPFQQAGAQALEERQALLGFGTPGVVQRAQDRILDNPAFKFQQRAGEESIDRAAAARGRLNSGRTLLQLRDFNQQLASNAFNERLKSLQLPISQGFGATAGRVGAITGAQGQATQAQLGGIAQQSAAEQQALLNQLQATQAGQAGLAGAIGSTITGAQIGGLFGKPQSNLPLSIVQPNRPGGF
ncbi:MAG: hypothetical protein CMI54_01770 [Parcubacteria group bacterium]|nr:hypothetical protein [Parcubacteria group bacterium]|tara:strand:- start:5279 stop:6073 length:795 start_codon:yes stop_codon:yes gene_type:complete